MTTDAQILCALRQSPGGAVSGAELSKQLGISRTAIWARIDELRALGYGIEASPHLGYRLLTVPDVLHADDLVSRLEKNCVIGRDIRIFANTTSTSDLIARLAQEEVEEGVVIFAESQTKGRGRLGRPWVSPPGKGLWFSVLLRPKLRVQAATQLTVATATALARAIHLQTGLQPAIKWPNDLLIGGKKIAGILTEINGEVDCVSYAILGIGVDVNVGADEFPTELCKTATSLKIEAGHDVNRADLAVAILRELDTAYARLCRGEFPAIAEEWRAACKTIGEEVSICIGDRQVHGRAETLDSDGALLVRTQQGHLERVIGGDVLLNKA